MYRGETSWIPGNCGSYKPAKMMHQPVCTVHSACRAKYDQCMINHSLGAIAASTGLNGFMSLLKYLMSKPSSIVHL
ncbi:hypothetical protein EXN66_Car001252 [Channa argus]|uniref:Uncharacterized protein n=1 Tax=Channa argus TaxID=215402 RepID=A0A6G1R0L9_CHAAH|nr:hypothetical protein EXN66_Car001252 [Channa argus]